jgi:hypothetical protein
MLVHIPLNPTVSTPMFDTIGWRSYSASLYGRRRNEMRIIMSLSAVLVYTASLVSEPVAKKKTFEPMPWHLVDIWWDTGRDSPFESYSIDVNISENVPSSINLYVAPIGLGGLSKTQFYGGIQTQMNGYTKRERRLRNLGPGFIFSMWGQRTHDAIRTSIGGYCDSSGHEGDFVSVRRPYKWRKGTYTYKLVKMDKEVVGGQAYTWVGVLVYSHGKDENVFVGALRFKGDKLILSRNIASFVEIYGQRKPVSAIPKLTVTFGNLIVNGVAVKAPTAKAIYPKGVPDYAEAKAKGTSIVVQVGTPIESRTARNVQLIGD